MKVFFDTDVLVYAFDGDAPVKRRKAVQLLTEHARTGDVVVSTQVLQEFYVTVTRKLAKPLADEAAAAATGELASFQVVAVDVPLVMSAIRNARQHGISLWDALIVEAAQTGGATLLLSEDLQSGQRFGGVTVTNPFA